jgi:magnesium-transporting ATPase (P-type)
LYTRATTQNYLGNDYVVCIQKEEVDDEDPPCSDNTALFLVSGMQYLITCMCFSVSKPHRKPVYTNPVYLVSLVAMLVYQLYITVFFD